MAGGELTAAIEKVQRTGLNGEFQLADLVQCQSLVAAAEKKVGSVSIGFFRGGHRHEHAMQLGRELRLLFDRVTGSGSSLRGTKLALETLWRTYDGMLVKYQVKNTPDQAVDTRHPNRGDIARTPIRYGSATVSPGGRQPTQRALTTGEIRTWLTNRVQLAAGAQAITTAIENAFDLTSIAVAAGLTVRDKGGRGIPYFAELVTLGDDLYLFWVGEDVQLGVMAPTALRGFGTVSSATNQGFLPANVPQSMVVWIKVVAGAQVIATPTASARFVAWKD